ncbi:MAG: hypothetical protein VXW87_00905 [Pseudomonadota bacterium]|nr:hypothetical protein [Pseudomonadota bacterium]
MIDSTISALKQLLGRPEALTSSQLSKILDISMSSEFKTTFSNRVCWEKNNVLLIDPYHNIPSTQERSATHAVTDASKDLDTTDSDTLSEDEWGVVDSDIPSDPEPPSRDDIAFDVSTGEIDWGQSSLGDLIQKIAIEFSGEPFRAIIALPEMRKSALSSVGHYTTMVIDNSNDQINVTVLDSQHLSTLKHFSFTYIFGHQYLNPDAAIQRKIAACFKKPVTFSRQRYNHQAEVLDTSCGYFTAKMMLTLFEASTQKGGLDHSINELLHSDQTHAVSIADRWGVALTSLDSFLTESDILQMNQAATGTVTDEVTIVSSNSVLGDSTKLASPKSAKALPGGAEAHPEETPESSKRHQ